MPKLRSLSSITTRLGKRYDKWKEWEGKKNLDKDDFFEAATLAAQKETLARQTISFTTPMAEDEARNYLAKYHPRWRVVAISEPDPDDGLSDGAILEEDPRYKTFAFVNDKDGKVYTRQVDNGSKLLDDERLAVDDPDLYKRITASTPWGERILWPLDKLDDDVLTQLSDYIYYDKPKVKLAAPRKAKADELI